MDSLDWNDLRYVLAVARSGSAAAAGRALGVSHATVLRRIQALEQGVGTALFDRLSTGYVPTEAGRKLTQVGESIESTLMDTTRVIDGQASQLAGSIRFTTTDSLASCIAPPLLASFSKRYPAIQVEMMITNQRLDLDRREADVTLRPSSNPPETWVGMRLPRFDFGIYAAPAYLDARKDVPWLELDWLLPGGPLAQGGASKWLDAQLGDRVGIAHVDSFVGLRALALAGMGATVLPCFMAIATPGLTLLQVVPPEASVDIWVLTHPHLRQSARIQAFMEHMAEGVRAMRGMLAAPATRPQP
jgi:DNA-binding transcriptional LysR family regulator